MHIRPLKDEEMPEDILNILSERFKGREIPTAYRILARNSKLIMKFIDFRDEIMKNGKLNAILKEKIALKVSAINKCNPCYVSHKRKLEMLGCVESEENEREKTVLQFAELAAINKGKVGDEAFSELSKYFSEDEVFEIVLVVSLYMFLNTFNSLLVI